MTEYYTFVFNYPISHIQYEVFESKYMYFILFTLYWKREKVDESWIERNKQFLRKILLSTMNIGYKYVESLAIITWRSSILNSIKFDLIFFYYNNMYFDLLYYYMRRQFYAKIIWTYKEIIASIVYNMVFRKLMTNSKLPLKISKW